MDLELTYRSSNKQEMTESDFSSISNFWYMEAEQ